MDFGGEDDEARNGVGGRLGDRDVGWAGNEDGGGAFDGVGFCGGFVLVVGSSFLGGFSWRRVTGRLRLRVRSPGSRGFSFSEEGSRKVRTLQSSVPYENEGR